MTWNFEKPDETNPGDHVFALVVYTVTGEIGVRSRERAEVRKGWGDHVFAWRTIDYPTFTVYDIEKVLRHRAVEREKKQTNDPSL